MRTDGQFKKVLKILKIVQELSAYLEFENDKVEDVKRSQDDGKVVLFRKNKEERVEIKRIYAKKSEFSE